LGGGEGGFAELLRILEKAGAMEWVGAHLARQIVGCGQTVSVEA
jgi:hypothetical protein